MVEANPPKANAASGNNNNANSDDAHYDKSFEQILQESGYSPDQVRGIATQLAQKKSGTRPDCVPGDQAMEVDSQSAATPQNATTMTGGIHTNDGTTVTQYFSYYAKLANQQNMMEDTVRTPCYRDAIVKNPSNFMGKVVMDVGCGSGILSLFAAQAGAKKVYACEASGAAEIARTLVKANGFEHVVEVIEKKIEDITSAQIPFKSVDVIVSEPLGTFLLNERMLETYIIARDMFLKPSGRMFPAKADLCVMPFTDETIYNEQLQKAEFWRTKDFHGLDLSCLHQKAFQQKFQQPILDTYDPVKSLSATPYKIEFDFESCTIDDLKTVHLEFEHQMNKTAILHGYAIWFDAHFTGRDFQITLHTGPEHPATHWYQTRLLIPEPLGVNKNQKILAKLKMDANNE